MSKRAEQLSAAGPEEALAMSLDRARRIDLDLTAGLLDVDTATARDLLQGLVYPDLDDPDELVPATTALSGNVRHKLADSIAACNTNRVYQDYVAALPGNLLVIDDADHLDPKQLRYFTEHAARTNTKLLLVHTPTDNRTPAKSLLDALAEIPQWMQR